MTRREAEVLEGLRAGRTNREIAGELYVSERTVESHVASLMRKLHARNRRELADRAEETAAEALRPPTLLPGALEFAASAPLIGRGRERDQLRALWDRAVQGVAVIAVVRGEAGMGKSRLVADLAVQVHREGAAVLHGACFEDSALPYEPFVHALGGELLGRIQPGDDVRQAILGRLKETTQHVPVLFVLEDLHWATAATRETLRFLARAAPRSRLLMALTSRDTPPDLPPETRELLGGLEREPSVHTITLTGLDTASVRELAASTEPDGALDDTAATSLVTETGGNPLLVLQALAAPHGLAGALTLQGLLASRARRLAPADHVVLDVAAILGAEFDVRVLAAVVGQRLDELLEALERAEAAGLIVSVPGVQGRWSFMHALFRRARYDAIPPARRLRVHRDVAQLLAKRKRAGAIDVAELAHHAYFACPLGDARLAIDACRRAGDDAARASAVLEAAVQYHRALEVADLLDPLDHAVVRDLRIRLGAILHNAGDPKGTSLLVEAAEDARTARDAHALAAVASALSYYGSGIPGSPDSTVAQLAEEALALASPERSRTRARMLGVLASQRAMAGETAVAGRLAEESLQVARSLGDPSVLGEALMTARLAVWTPNNLDQRIAIARELAHLGDVSGTRLWSICGRQGIAAFEREQGDLAASFRALDEVDGLIGDRPPAWTALLWVAMRANRLFLEGDLAGSERVGAELFALELQRGPGAGAWIDPALWYRPQLLAIRYYQGRVGELSTEIEHVPLGAASRAIAASVLAHGEELDRARALLDEDLRSDFALYPEDSTWLVSMGWLAEAAELTGHVAAARALSERLHPYLGRLDNYGDGAFRPIGSALTQTALAAGDAAGAASLAESTISWCRRQGSPIFLARGLVQLAAARRRLGDSRLDCLEEALSISAETGAALVQQDVERYDLPTAF